VNVELGLSLGEKNKTINWGQNPEKPYDFGMGL
jgi:hypothetical protein